MYCYDFTAPTFSPDFNPNLNSSINPTPVPAQALSYIVYCSFIFCIYMLSTLLACFSNLFLDFWLPASSLLVLCASADCLPVADLFLSD